MDTLSRILVLSGLLRVTFSDIIVLQELPQWIEVGEVAPVAARWEQNIGADVMQFLVWSADDQGIRKETRNNQNSSFVYASSPIPADRQTIDMNWEGQAKPDDPSWIVQNSVLRILDFQVTDPEEYSCSIEIGRELKTAISVVKAYAIPTVTIENVTMEADVRAPIPETDDVDYPEYNTTEVDNTDLDDVYNAAESDYTESDYPDRKKRQVDATLEDAGPVEEDAKYVEVACNIQGAYPQPEKVEFTIGERDTMQPSETPVWSQDPVTRFYSSRVILKLAADPMYDGKRVVCSVTLPNAAVENSGLSPPFVILHETDKVTTTISPEDAIEGDTVMIECRANGNPAPRFTVMSDVDDKDFTEDESGTKFTIAAVTRQHQGRYWCVASFDDRADPGSVNTLDSEDKPELVVRYIDTPDLSRNEITGKKGDNAQVTCTAKGSPQPSATWKKNGQTVSGSSVLMLNDMKYSDSGKYLCVTTNDAGEKNKELMVIVEGTCNIQFNQPDVTASKEEKNAYRIAFECTATGKPECAVSIVPPENFGLKGKTSKSNGVVTMVYESVPKLSAPVKFACVASNKHTPKYNKTVQVDSKFEACCSEPSKGGLGTGAIVGILLLVLVVVIGIPLACYFVKKRNAPPKKKTTDEEAGAGEKEGLNRETSSEDSDTGSLPPPPADSDTDHRLGNAHEMSTFSTNK